MAPHLPSSCTPDKPMESNSPIFPRLMLFSFCVVMAATQLMIANTSIWSERKTLVAEFINKKQLPSNLNNERVDPILRPVINEGKSYSVCRKDRSGSVILDMLYAHAFAFAHNLTYAGNCCVTRGIPKKDTRNLIEDLHWNKILPFQCPEGVDNKKYNLKNPNATSIHPLMLNDTVYKLHSMSNFNPDWKKRVSKALSEFSDQSDNRTFHIAVHIRRDDVSPCKLRDRYLPNDHYLQLIDQYMPSESQRNGRPVQVTIYSESNSFEPLDVFVERNFTLKLDTERLSDIWKAISTADVAIISRSCFSIVPAIINPNTVVASEFKLFDVEVMDGWKHADPSLVQASDAFTGKLAQERCNSTGNS